jgi:hypothetical protein
MNKNYHIKMFLENKKKFYLMSKKNNMIKNNITYQILPKKDKLNNQEKVIMIKMIYYIIKLIKKLD